MELIKITKTSFNIFPVIGLFSLLLISASAVSLMNPIVETSSQNINSGNVAGVSTINNQAIEIKEDFFINSSFNINKFNSTQEESKILASYVVSKDTLSYGTYTENFLSFYNPNNAEVRIKSTFYIPEDLKGKIKVYLEDEFDSLIMYTTDLSFGPKTITFDPLEQRNFRFRIEAVENIETNVQLIFSFAVGQ